MVTEFRVTPTMTVPDVLKARVALIPDQVAQICDDERHTFKEFGQLVNRLAANLVDLGIQPREKVALILPSGNTFPIAMYGVIQMGGVIVSVNPTLRPNEIKHILIDSDAVAVIVSDQFHDIDPLGIVRDLKGEMPNIRQVIVEGRSDSSEQDLQALLASPDQERSFHQANVNDLAALIYTSGTTGFPKGSMHSHRTLLSPLIDSSLPKPTGKQVINIIRRFGLRYFLRVARLSRKPLKILMSMPPYTGAGIIGMVNNFLMGRTTVHVGRFTPGEFLKVVAKEDVNVLALTPALGTMVTRYPKLNDFDFHSLMYIALGTAPTPPVLVDVIMEKIGVPVMIGYGATEIVGAPAMTDPFNDPLDMLRETVGKVAKGWEAKIVDEARNPVPLGEIGELVIRGGIPMLGYYKAEALTKLAFDDEGWYYTGDLATMDKHGYVRIVGRLKDMIIRAGQNIYPAEIENIITSHPKIQQAAVVGIPDAIAGERVLAYVILKDGHDLTAVEFLNFCRENMAAYKVPANVYFVDSFPLNATGKVLKRELRAQAIEQGE